MKRKLLSTFFALCMLLSLLPTAALAAETEEYVAEVNGTSYTTLQDAVDSASAGNTVKVIRNIVIDGSTLTKNVYDGKYSAAVLIDKEITLDLDGHTINWTQNGQGDAVFALGSGANVTVTGNGTMNCMTGSNSSAIAFWLLRDANAELTVKDGTYYSEEIIYLNDNGGKATIEGGYFSDPTYGGHCQLLNVYGYLAFGEGKQISMTGGTLDCRDPRYLNDGNAVADGYVVRKVTKSDGKRDYTVIPESKAVGFYKADTADYDYNHNDTRWNAAFNENFPTKSRFAYTVEDAVARIGDKYYRTLYSAVYNAESGDIVKLLKDVEIESKELYSDSSSNGTNYYTWVYVNGKDLTLDLDGHTISIADSAKNQANTQYRLFLLMGDSKMTVTGNGKIAGDAGNQGAASAFVLSQQGNSNGGSLIIENGTFSASGAEIIYAFPNNRCTINGGTFEGLGENYDTSRALNCNGGGSTNNYAFSITGGTYIGFDPRNMDDGNLVAEGSCVKASTREADNATLYTVAVHGKDCTSAVTKDPTYTEAGERTYSCANCGEIVKTEEIAKLTHSSGGGGGSSVTQYAITVADTQNGSVTADKKRAAKNATVTLAVSPAQGYTLETLTVTDKNGAESKLTDKGDGTYTFQMPDSKVTVTSVFQKEAVHSDFVDVPTDSYYYDAVQWAAQEGITQGVDDTHFAPDASCTRAQIVTFLWRTAGSPASAAGNNFADVPADNYYAAAVAWAVDQGIVKGTSETTFSPDEICTRSHAVTFLFRYAAAQGMDTATQQELVSGYLDATQVPGYALPAFNWALADGIVQGADGNLMPNDACTRAQIVTLLYRLEK